MSGWLTNGVAAGSIFTGLEQASFDTENARGSNPQTISITVQKLSQLLLYYGSIKDRTTVNGSRYVTSVGLGQGGVITGFSVLIGGTGGTDNWIVELHDSTGALVATSALAGVLAGTALSWQQIPFTAPVTIAAGVYYAVLQSNGTTAKPSAHNSPTSPLLTSSQTGVFGTSASITPPTTYTADLGVVMLPY